MKGIDTVNDRFYSVLILDYSGDAFDEWWKISGGGFEGALEAAFKKIECDYMVKEIFFWNENVDRPFAHIDREEGLEEFNDVTEYFKISC